MGVVNQESCFICPYRNQSAADIRLGDYWGKRFEKTEDGVSMVVTNNEHGERIIETIRNMIEIEPQNITERLAQQHTDYEYPKYYKESLEMLRDETIDFKSVINLYESNFQCMKKKVKKFIKVVLRI